jgi:hypothetical protein
MFNREGEAREIHRFREKMIMDKSLMTMNSPYLNLERRAIP